MTTIKILAAVLAIAAIVTFTSSGNNENNSVNKAEIDSLKIQITQLTSGKEEIAKHLATFDTLDYTIFSNQDWTRMHESHSKDIKVIWPDGHIAIGIEKHIEDLKALFVYSPDTRIKEHPVRFGSGNMTAVTGVFEGTSTKPMPIENGKFIQPTGKAFKMPMATIGIWEQMALCLKNICFGTIKPT